MKEPAGDQTVKKLIDLFLISFLSLYFEILFIRWIPSSIQITAFFTNIVLFASFLGLGLGCLLAGARIKLMDFFFLFVLGILLAVLLLRRVDVSVQLSQGEVLRGFYAVQGVNFLVIIAVIFCLISALFLPLGQQLGLSLRSFPPLAAYSLNISGGILGVAAFSYLSSLMLSPVYWFIAGLALSLWFVAGTLKRLVLNAGVFFLALLVIAQMDAFSYWSPYQKIDISPISSSPGEKPQDFSLSINSILLQFAFNLSDERIMSVPYLKHYKAIYEFPYTLRTPQRVLVLGAGSGNDVAAAIRKGAQEIDAVEIDPLIARLGRTLHPERPYLSPKVKVFVDDARSYIRRTNKTYGIITFGYLDAHRVLSQFSSVRMDNFIYTKESFSDIRKRLEPGGYIVLTYLGSRRWIEEKLFFGLKEVFGEDVRAIRTTTYIPDDTAIFVAGDGARNLALPASPYFRFDKEFSGPKRFITDDWPYLYLRQRGIPLHYVIILLFVLLFSAWAVRRTDKLNWKRFNAHFFFLGAGFLLLETVSITRSALLFGSTWVVNSAVFVSIMIMVLLANAVVAKARAVNTSAVYILLFCSIALNWLIKPAAYLSLHPALSVVFASAVMSLPLFFAGIIFAGSFKKAGDITGVFGFNLLGAIVGGLCEYISMWSGFTVLYLAAMAMYAASLFNLRNPASLIFKPYRV